MKKLISIVIPCYNEESALRYVYEAITAEMRPLKTYEYEILLINDGSKDNTLNKMRELAAKDSHVNTPDGGQCFGLNRK